MERWLAISFFVNFETHVWSAIFCQWSLAFSVTGFPALLEIWLAISFFVNFETHVWSATFCQWSLAFTVTGFRALLEIWLAISFFVNLETHVWFATFCQWTLGSNKYVSLPRTCGQVWKESKSLKILYKTLIITTYVISVYLWCIKGKSPSIKFPECKKMISEVWVV